VTLERDLERVLREIAARTQRPFKKVLNETLRVGIEQVTGTGGAQPFVVEARPMGLRAGHDPAGFNKLADDLEAEAFLETTRNLLKHER